SQTLRFSVNFKISGVPDPHHPLPTIWNGQENETRILRHSDPRFRQTGKNGKGTASARTHTIALSREARKAQADSVLVRNMP
ncbi:MAG: hypothetical protein KDA84_08430, partial [Planctomycetaceae bacterium]|nr:hypothetical protein [Planctomycetaceae bacterium]